MFPAEICAAKLPEMVVGSLRGWNKAILLFSLLIAGVGHPRRLADPAIKRHVLRTALDVD
jgi:hypothetical protein